MNLPIINSHNSWARLEEVWLGDIYPKSWYDHLAPEIKDIFYQLTEITQEDLDKIQKTLMEFKVKVRRPIYNNIDDYIRDDGHLKKPSITPRDDFVVIGNNLYIGWQQPPEWTSTIDEYKSDSRSMILPGDRHYINGANVVRIGKDIIIDVGLHTPETRDGDVGDYPGYRVHVVENGGHLDGCFAILRPGLILANQYFDDYDRLFPGWEVLKLNDPVYRAAPSTGYKQPYPVYNGKFWDTGVGSNHSFNDHVIQHALDWVGMYTETYFELNCLVVDETNVIMLAENERLANDLSRRGITVHWVPFRARSFWDGGVHCLTLDIRRQSVLEDFFPERTQ